MAHIVPKILVALPYVDRKPLPDERPDQKRIEWIRVGECLGAAETIIDNSGEMNRSGVQVQKNAVTLYENDLILNNSLTEVINRVNNHDDVLGQIGDDNLLTKIKALEDKVEPMDEKITEHSQQIFLIDEAGKLLNLKVGDRVAGDTTIRTVMADLTFIKRDQLGNWTNQDFNGNEDPGATASGIKYRMESQGLAIANNTRRIVQLEENWINSDVGQLKADIDQIRVEMGPSILAPAVNVYSWIKSADATHTALQTNIDTLQDAIGNAGGGTTIAVRLNNIEADVTDNTQNIGQNANEITRLNFTVGDSTIPSSLQYRVIGLESTITKHDVSLYGLDGNTGITATIQAIGTEIGDDTVANSIKGRLVETETETLKVQQDISTIKTQIGNNISGAETGIYRRLKEVEASVGSPTDGLIKNVADNTAAIALKLSDAPNDTKQYVRSAGAWKDLNDYIGDLAVRAAGGWYFNGSADTVTLAGTATDLELPALTEFTFNTEVEATTDKKLKFIRAKSAICQLNVELGVKYTNAQNVMFSVLKNGRATGAIYTIASAIPGPKEAIAKIAFPVECQSDDVFMLQVTTDEADSVEVLSGQMYLIQMS